MQAKQFKAKASYVQNAANSFVLFLAAIVIFGWIAHIPFLVSLNTGVAQMQLNTALGFILCALGGLCISWLHSRIGQALVGALLIGLAGLTLAQYAFELNLAIDDLFLTPFVQYETKYSGRMSIMTAACFLSIGTYLVVHSWQTKRAIGNVILFSACIIALGLSLASLITYAFPSEAQFAWQKLTRMAPHTSIGFLILATSNLAHQFQKIQTRTRANLWLPVTVALLVYICVTTLSFYLKQSEQKTFTKAANQEATAVLNELHTLSEQVFRAFYRLSSRMTYTGQLDKSYWRKDAKEYLHDFPFYQAIEWIDNKHVVRWVEPVAGNQKLIGFDNKKNDLRKEQFEKARKSKKALVTNTFSLVQGGRGFLYIQPLYKEGRFLGSSVAVFKASVFFEALKSGIRNQSIQFSVFENNTEIYVNQTKTEKAKLSFTLELPFLHPSWRLQATPTSSMQAQFETGFPETVFIFGVILATILASIIYLVQTNLIHQKQAISAKAQLAEHSKVLALGTLAGGVSHEINNPLAILLGYLSSLESLFRSNQETDHEKIVSIVTKAKNSAARISKIVNGLHFFCGELSHEQVKPTKANEILQQTVDFCQEKLKRNQITFYLKNNTEEDQFIKVSGVQISQVLLNLITNATDEIKHQENPWIELQIYIDKGSMCFSVTDSGAGIPKHIQEKLMTPFFTTKEIGKGTGLGLSVSKGIIERFNGRLYYDKTAKNTRFIAQVPLTEDVPEEASHAAPNDDTKKAA